MSLRPDGVPIHFGARPGAVFGCWHAPAGRARALGLVICPPFGREALSAHRSLRALAIACAGAGFHVLRVDPPGTGDSPSDPRASDPVDGWLRGIDQAADELRRLSGVTAIALLGLRSGAWLATHAALRRDDVRALIGWVPVIGSRTWLREARLLARAAIDGESASPAAPENGADGSAAAGDLEFGGFVLDAETRAALARLDVWPISHAPAADVLILERDDMPTRREWAGRLAALGARVALHCVDGYAAMMLDPEHSRLARAYIERTVEWLDRLAPAAPDGVTGVGYPSQATCELPDAHERAVRIDVAGVPLAGVVGVPHRRPTPPRAVLLPNAGATRRIGPGRLYVDLARSLYRDGWIVLRVDLSGLGDSDARGDSREGEVYSASAVGEVRALARWLRQEYGAVDCRGVGLCSGAYHAFKAAVAGDELDGVVAINPLTFFWRADAQPAVPDYKLIGEMRRYRAATGSGGRLRRLLRGEVDLAYVASVLAARAAGALRDASRECARCLRWPLTDDLAAEVRRVLTRRASLDFVFARGDPGIELLRRQGGRQVRRLERDGRFGVHFIEHADHTFTRHARRQELIDTVIGLLNTPRVRPDPDRSALGLPEPLAAPR